MEKEKTMAVGEVEEDGDLHQDVAIASKMHKKILRLHADSKPFTSLWHQI